MLPRDASGQPQPTTGLFPELKEMMGVTEPKWRPSRKELRTILSVTTRQNGVETDRERARGTAVKRF